ncbi:MAG: tetratricopeptide repeat protein [Magnetococcales bacterium]|nr:tetratricopeptide repeat protein [Magnetococcales bacterium]
MSKASKRRQVGPGFDRAVEYLLQGRLDEAETIVRNVLQTSPNHADALHLLGVIAYQRGQWGEAVSWISKAVAQRPGFVEAYNNLGLAYHALGRWPEAAESYRRALAIQPRSSETHNNLGNVLREMGQCEEAVTSLRTAIALNPNYFQAYNNLGIALLDLGQWEAAVAQYEQAMTLKPDFAPAYRNLGNAFHQNGCLERAIPYYLTLIQLQPQWPEAYASLGELFYRLQRWEESLKYWGMALHLQPENREFLHHAGLLLMALKRWDEAQALFKKILQGDGDHPQAWLNLGIILQEQGHLDQSVDCLQKAASLQPSLGAALGYWGSALQKLGRHEEALEILQHALQIDPADTVAMATLGFVYQELGDIESAVVWYDKAILQDPSCAEAHFGKSLAHLLHGAFEMGWRGYEWRWKTKDFSPHLRPEPLWDGGDLHGEMILLHCEQGFGDSLLGIRFVPWVRQRGGRIAFLCPEPLEALFRGVAGIDFLTSVPQHLPPCVCQSPLLSLPGLLGIIPTALPTTAPYLFADPIRMQRFEDIGQRRGVKVGLVWRGNPNHKNDRNRSLPVEHLGSLLDVAGCCFFLLQRDIRKEELAVFSGRENVVDLSTRLGDFSDTAAALARLDVIVTVDTALLHLAGALGRLTWAMLPLVPDWRWMRHGEETPWYPTVRLFRQRQRGDWDPVIGAIKAALSEKNDKLHDVASASCPLVV